MSPPSERTRLYHVGINVTHSPSPPMHNHIAQFLGFPYTFTNTECPSLSDVMAFFRAPSFAGGVITMPYKQTIIPYLDEFDPLCTKLGACNNVYLTTEGKLRGTNTDWRGVKGCLVEGETKAGKIGQGKGKPALIVGAGGASRAAVYALVVELGASEVYIINRDEAEVTSLINDTKNLAPHTTHVKSLAQASALPTPFYVVGCIPNFPPTTPDEILVQDILKDFLGREEKGVLLDMCYKPRNTIILLLGRENGWEVVDGTGVIGHQVEEQWRLWVGAGEGSEVGSVPLEEAWAVLRNQADMSTVINQ